MECQHCHNEIDEDSKWFKDASKPFHFDCYIEHKMSLKRHRTREKYLAKAEELYQHRILTWQSNKLKDEFWAYIQDVYNISMIPTYTFIKMDSINKGTFKGLNKPIPLEDLFNMFKSKREVLDKIHGSNMSKGKDMDNLGRFNYDTAVLLGQYDKYIKWKEKQSSTKSEEISKENVKKIVSFNKIKPRSHNISSACDFNVDDMVDEI